MKPTIKRLWEKLPIWLQAFLILLGIICGGGSLIYFFYLFPVVMFTLMILLILGWCYVLIYWKLEE